MRKILLLCLFATSLAAQPGFQKKIQGLQSAEGLTLMPDGGYLLAGLKGNCIQIVRFDSVGTTRWMRQVCPINPSADFTIRGLQLMADEYISGDFLLLFRKGAFSSSPDNLLNLMKFDASGTLLWESQLRPEKRYGSFSSGSQFSITSQGTIWACHGMGLTDLLPDFNQVLVFKTTASGQTLLRRYFKTDEPSIANGIAAENEQEIYVYGSLGNAITDGFILKINTLGEVVWSNRYAGMHFLRDGGFFPNGDLLLMAEQHNAFALCRIKSDGTLAWASKLTDTLSLFHCAVAMDGGVLVAGRKPNAPALFFKTDPVTGAAVWAKTYEDCTRHHTTALRPLADGGFVFLQSAATGSLHTRMAKADDLGILSPECPFWALDLPGLKDFSFPNSPIQFVGTDGLIQGQQHFFEQHETSIEILDCCPTEYPDAQFLLPDSVCSNAPFSLISAGNTCSDEWSWEISGAIPQTSQETDFQDIIFKNAGNFQVVLTETLGVCSDTFSGILHVVTPGTADIFTFSDTVICPDVPFVLQPDLAGFDAWTWEDGSTAPTRIFELPVAGTYRLSVRQGLCEKADSIQVKIGNCGPTRVFVPNVFSPNEDGQNDFWEVFAQKGVILLECRVFDRWGNLCYRAASEELPRWDGRSNDQPMPAGVYVWQFRVRNVEGVDEILSGDLLLVR